MRLLFLLMCVVLILPAYLIICEENDRSPTITMECAKKNVVAGEPTPLALTIVNRSSHTIEFALGIPAFYIWSDPGKLAFFDPEGKIDLLPNQWEILRKKSFDVVVGGGRLPIYSLSPGESWQETIYLERYVKPLPAGDHNFDYNVELPYDSIAKDEKGALVRREDRMAGRGKIKMSVKRATPAQLDAIIAHYSSLLWPAPGYDAEEALCLIDSPSVVPVLVRKLHECRSDDNVMLALSRFSHNKEALAAVRACLKDPDQQIVYNARRVLKEWNEGVNAAAGKHDQEP